jgi:hypothetical protein
MTGTELADALADFVNGGDKKDVEEFVQQLTNRTHKTLQQGAMRLFVATIEKWASLNENQYDLRNEATVKLAKRIINATGDKYDRGLPLV